ncbi:MAG: hypothetical protein AAF926_03775 [Pseudomonadota bacterium]
MTELSRDQIDKAEAAGIIPPKQARAMRTALDAKAPSDPAPSEAVIGDEDTLRFLRSFGDVFIGIGLILLALGVTVVTRFVGGGGPAFLLAAAGAYAMAEWFGRRKRAHFPTLITALAFLIFVQTGLNGIAVLGGLTAALVTVAAMALFYWRIRLPFCIALIAIALLYLLFALLAQFAPDLLQSQFGAVLFLSGLAVFTVALLYDRQDTHRRTRFADNAFWLHVLAAPLIIHGLVGHAVMAKAEMLMDVIPILSFSRSDAFIILIVTAIIIVIGLAINRRALIVSSLGYTGLSIAFLVRETQLNLGTTIAVTLMLLGGAIVLLGVAWHPVRNQLIRILPSWRIFPPPYEPGPT